MANCPTTEREEARERRRVGGGNIEIFAQDGVLPKKSATKVTNAISM